MITQGPNRGHIAYRYCGDANDRDMAKSTKICAYTLNACECSDKEFVLFEQYILFLTFLASESHLNT